MFGSILDLRESPYKGSGRPNFFVDLNVDQVIDRISLLWGERVADFYYYLPADAECEAYRREVMADVKKGNLYARLMTFVGKMKEYEKAVAGRNSIRSKTQKATWHIKEVILYIEAFQFLQEALEQAELTSQGMQDLCTCLQTYLTDTETQEMYQQAKALQAQKDSIRFRLTYENNLVVVAIEETEGTYEAFLENAFGSSGRERKGPFSHTMELTNLEAEVIEILQKKKPEFFKALAGFYRKYEDFARPEFLQFATEITYYLSYYKFQQKMMEQGFAFVAPTVCEKKPMCAEGLYDLALACVNSAEQKEVVSNDMMYQDGEQFFVVTGPNQGGKTTFARSLGQLVYFSKMGLDVPACSANVHSFSSILTHFSVEESVESGRGKLQEELMRLQPMMATHCKDAFVIINELFTTAANYDACIMGQKVLQHFIGQNCMGIYVTHLKELTQAHERVVSMRATLDEQGKQTHKILRQEADDVACAINQVNKYHLTYAQLKERLS